MSFPKNLLCFLIILFVSLTSAEALSISSLRISSDIQGKYDYQEIILELVNTPDDKVTLECAGEFSFPVPLGAHLVYLKDMFGDVDYTLGDDTLSMTFPQCIPLGQERLVFLKVRSKQVNELSKDSFRYVFDFTPTQGIPTFEHVVKLPYGVEEGFLVDVKPPTEPLYKENRLVLSWDYTDLETSATHIVLYKKTPSKTPLIFYILPTLLILALIAFFVLRKLKKKSEIAFIQTTIAALNEKEKAIIDVVLNNEGIHQSKIRNKLNMTKSNLSKTLAKLEFRALLVRKNEGKINRWFLGEKLKKPKN